jgi:4a-hydroxytetrahydrobiopterin dehydratase
MAALTRPWDSTITLCAVSNLLLQPNAEPLSLDDARRLLFKVVGWRLVLSGGDGDGDEQRPARLQCVWKVRDETYGQELIARINAALHGAGHAPAALAFEAPNQVTAKLFTSSAAGDSLTMTTSSRGCNCREAEPVISSGARERRCLREAA